MKTLNLSAEALALVKAPSKQTDHVWHATIQPTTPRTPHAYFSLLFPVDDHRAIGYYTCIAKEDVMLALRLPKDIERRLEALAKRTGRSKSFYAREAILEHLEDLEAEYLSDEILKRVETGQEQTYTLDELERELGLED